MSAPRRRSSRGKGSARSRRPAAPQRRSKLDPTLIAGGAVALGVLLAALFFLSRGGKRTTAPDASKTAAGEGPPVRAVADAGAPPRANATDGWKRHVSKAGGFSVELPAAPTSTTGRGESGLGELEILATSAKVDGELFAVMRYRLTSGDGLPQKGALLDQLIDNGFRTINPPPTDVQRRPFRPAGGGMGYEVTGRVGKGADSGEVRSRAILTPRRFFQLLYVGKAGQADRRSRRFFDSFRPR